MLNLDEPHTNWAPTQNNLNHLWLEFAAGRSTGNAIVVFGELSSLAEVVKWEGNKVKIAAVTRAPVGKNLCYSPEKLQEWGDVNSWCSGATSQDGENSGYFYSGEKSEL